MRLNVVSLEDRIDSVREKLGEKIEVGKVSSVVGEVMGSFDGEFDLHEAHFQDELAELLRYIEQAKADLTQIQPKHLSENKIPEASGQLDQVIATTEEAATRIMDAAEEIAELSTSMEGEMAERLETISTHIFEASSFQDITGQRVTKVVNTLKYLEEKLESLAHAIGDTDSHIKAQEEKNATDDPGEEDLLHGPQCQVTGNDQDDIDALLASFD